MPPKPPTPKLTHFLCLPLITPTSRPQLQTSLNTFREKVTQPTRENPDGIPEAAVRPLGTLHLTLGVMSLLSQDRVESALSLLRSLNLKEMLLSAAKEDSNVKEKEELRITLKGLKSMHAPTSTSTLFAPPVSSPTLLNFCQQLKDAFTAAELLVPDSRPLLLHATVVNTIYVPGVKGKGGGHGKRKAKLTFDASEILEDWEDFVWMEDVRVEKVAICRMGAVKGEDGEEAYGVEGTVDMP